LKFLFVINNSSPSNIPHVRHTFHEFVNEGFFSDYKEYPFRERITHYNSSNKMGIELISLINSYKPDVLLWNQLAGAGIPKQIFHRIRKAIPKSVLIQESADTFFSIPSDMIKAGRVFDLTLLTCGGLIDNFRKKGCKNVILFPEKADHVQFGKKPESEGSKKYDVVMVANRLNIRNPFRKYMFPGKNPMFFMDGQNLREKLVDIFTRKFGDRFALFGYGWDGYKASKGFLKFSEQESVLQSAHMSLGTNNFNNVSYYFSNRVVNSLISGVPHLCKRSKDLEFFFKDKEHLFYFETPEEAVDIAETILRKNNSNHSEIGKNGRELVIQKHTARIRYEYMLELINAFKTNTLNQVKPNFFIEIPHGYSVV